MMFVSYRPKEIASVAQRLALLVGISVVCVACNTTPSHRTSAVPPTYSSEINRPPGAINTPNNSGNPPEDLNPHTIHWGDVRPNY